MINKGKINLKKWEKRYSYYILFESIKYNLIFYILLKNK